MRQVLRRLVVWMMTLCMAATASAEEGVWDFSALLPLVDLTASAAMRVGETPENITADGVLSETLVYNFFLMGVQADASLGITADMLADPAAQTEYLNQAFTAKATADSAIVAFEESYDYIGLQVMASDMDDASNTLTLYGDLYQAEDALNALSEEQQMRMTWLNWRAVVQLHRDEQVPGGWKIDSFTFEPSVALTMDGQDSYHEATLEYVNSELGFSVQYPAEFAEDTMEEGTTGMTATLKDGTATFCVSRTANTQGISLDDRIQQVAGQYADATAAIHEVSQTGRVTGTWANGFIGVTAIIVTDSWIYEAQLSYAPEKADTFAMYSEYMINSFMVDELGIG